MSTNNGDQTNKAKIPAGGFLPIKTNAFDRVFIAIVIFVAVHLLWMRFLELYVPLYAATVLSVMIGTLIVLRG